MSQKFAALKGDAVSDMTCDVCGKPTPTGVLIERGIRVARICWRCTPFRRCGELVGGRICLGLMQSAGSARTKCDRCGRKGRL